MMMKAFFSIALVVLFLQPQLSNTLVWLHYEVNKAQITADFCVNKAEPEKQCHGKCHLAKQLTAPVVPTSNPPETMYIPQLDLYFLFDKTEELIVEVQKTPECAAFRFNSVAHLREIDKPPKGMSVCSFDFLHFVNLNPLKNETFL